jgi:hypothetical protein
LIRDNSFHDLLQLSHVHIVFHDIRQSAEILRHKFEVELCNIIDTLFVTWALYAAYLPKSSATAAAAVTEQGRVQGTSLQDDGIK